MSNLSLATPTSLLHRRVLIVEDQLELSTLLYQAFKKADPEISIDWATSAESAFFLLKENDLGYGQPPYEMILIDIFLDGKETGIDFWDKCRKIHPSIPVVFTSSLSLDRFFAAIGSDRVAPSYLQKPFSIDEAGRVFYEMLKYSKHQKSNYCLKLAV